ncbi:MAG TPA: APC family permease [Candidatus Acidoferrales bacterium]|nr:APC family permease [Candidatus Acidoferrales bacterium]
MGEQKVFVRDATGLVRQLSAWDVLMFNLLNMGLGWPLLYSYFGAGSYPGVNLALAVIVGLVPNFFIALLYYYMTVAMPRSGGDYVWVSRLIHPSIGFMESFAIFVFYLGFIGPVSGFAMTFGLGTIFTNLGIATGNQAYLGMASAVASQNSILVGSLLILVVLIGAAAFGLKSAFRLQWAMFVLMSVGIVVFLIALAAASPASFVQNFNNLSGTTYSGLFDAAKKAGIVTDFTLSGTIIGSFWAFVNYLGYFTSAYVGGEVKQASRSQFIGIIGSTLIFAALALVMYGAPYLVWGGGWFSAISQLSVSANSAYTLPSAPVYSFLIIFANPSPWIAILVPMAILGTVVGSLETIVLMAVRMVFAWSFDGITPVKLAQIDERRGSPNYALALVAVVGLIYVLLSIFAANVLTFNAYATSGLFLAFAIAGIAAVMFPYKHKDLFEIAPTMVKRRIAGVPVVAILGVITFLTGLFVAYIAASPIFTGVPVNPFYLVGMIGVFVVGLVIYFISAAYQKSKGVDMSMRFKRLPPE